MSEHKPQAPGNAHLEALGVTVYVRRQQAGALAVSSKLDKSAESSPPAGLTPVVATADWEALQAEVAACMACGLHKSRTQTVFGVGDRQAHLMIVGEAPGADEDRLGEPFVGRAGRLLDAMLKAIGLTRQQVFIANVLKCRPPNNRNPSLEEATACLPFLKRQIALVSPRLILAVGGVAAHHLLHTQDSVGRLRKRTHYLQQPANIPVRVTYHPAYLLRRPEEKAKAWDDLQQLHALLESFDA